LRSRGQGGVRFRKGEGKRGRIARGKKRPKKRHRESQKTWTVEPGKRTRGKERRKKQQLAWWKKRAKGMGSQDLVLEARDPGGDTRKFGENRDIEFASRGGVNKKHRGGNSNPFLFQRKKSCGKGTTTVGGGGFGSLGGKVVPTVGVRQGQLTNGERKIGKQGGGHVGKGTRKTVGEKVGVVKRKIKKGSETCGGGGGVEKVKVKENVAADR